MRYTTVIDISEFPSIYRNPNARALYFHMALKAGYHDNDRDVLETSLRILQAETGLSFSAVRHALHLLEGAALIRREGSAWIVKKWIPAQTISARPKATQKQLDAAQEEQRQRARQERKEELERLRREEIMQQGKTEFMIYYEGLQDKAAAGDPEALRLVERHRATYEAHQANMRAKVK